MPDEQWRPADIGCGGTFDNYTLFFEDGTEVTVGELKLARAVQGAAPEMLQALRHCRLVLESILADEETKEAGLWQGEMIPRALDLVNDSIAKAEGDS